MTAPSLSRMAIWASRRVLPQLNRHARMAPGMAYVISIDVEHGIAELSFAGKTTHAEHVKAKADLLEKCAAHHISKILVDARRLEGQPPTTLEIFDFAVSWVEHARNNPVLLAGVLPRDASTREWWRFGESVAANRGFFTRGFDSLDEARAWLRQA
jgi:hypothetical protein